MFTRTAYWGLWKDRGDVWHGGIYEVSIDSECCDLSRKVDEDLVCEILRFDYDRRDNGRE